MDGVQTVALSWVHEWKIWDFWARTEEWTRKFWKWTRKSGRIVWYSRATWLRGIGSTLFFMQISPTCKLWRRARKYLAIHIRSGFELTRRSGWAHVFTYVRFARLCSLRVRRIRKWHVHREKLDIWHTLYTHIYTCIIINTCIIDFASACVLYNLYGFTRLRDGRRT